MTAREILCWSVLHAEREKEQHQRRNQLPGKWLADTEFGVDQHGITQSADW